MNPAAYLSCRRCGATSDLDAPFGRCATCAGDGSGAVLEVAYDAERIALDPITWGDRGPSLWQFAALLPAMPKGDGVSLGEGNTPLVKSRSIGPELGMNRLLFKNETTNPTWSHKDRFHAVAIAVAERLGCYRVVASSTGNHGAAAAAYASRGGMRALVLCPPEVSQPLLGLIRVYGGEVVVTDWEARDAMGRHLVTEHGWYPATGLDPAFAFSPNPYGIEGHKTIAYEIVRDLGKVPHSVFIPCAGGDTLYGVWKGFNDLWRLGLADQLPRLYGCQPAGADALRRSLQDDLGAPVVLNDPRSVATSVRERSISAHAVEVVRQSGGGAPTATDDEILEAMRWLGREGLCVEPASALPLACVRNLLRSGELDPEETVVCVMTAAGIKWPDALALVTEDVPRIAPTIDALERHLVASGLLG